MSPRIPSSQRQLHCKTAQATPALPLPLWISLKICVLEMSEVIGGLIAGDCVKVQFQLTLLLPAVLKVLLSCQKSSRCQDFTKDSSNLISVRLYWWAEQCGCFLCFVSLRVCFVKRETEGHGFGLVGDREIWEELWGDWSKYIIWIFFNNKKWNKKSTESL